MICGHRQTSKYMGVFESMNGGPESHFGLIVILGSHAVPHAISVVNFTIGLFNNAAVMSKEGVFGYGSMKVT
jgi:hypothetical protein